MFQALLIVHLLLCVIMVAAILMQRSEGGGALGIGGGPNSMMSGRSATNAMTRITQFMAAAFFATSIGLTLLASASDRPATSIMEEGNSVDGIPVDGIDLGGAPAEAQPEAPAEGGGLLDLPASSAVPEAPAGEPETPPVQ